MFNVCYNCGLYHADKQVDYDLSVALCPACNFRHPITILPLFIVGGASGTGKSTVLPKLVGTIDEVVLLEADILWGQTSATSNFFEVWLRIAKNIAQSGLPVALFGAGFVVPENLESCIERRYFSTIHYLGLTCSEEAQIERLQSRPTWRHTAEILDEQVAFNRWVRENAEKTTPPIELLDTTNISVEETAAQIRAWIKRKRST